MKRKALTAVCITCIFLCLFSCATSPESQKGADDEQYTALTAYFSPDYLGDLRQDVKSERNLISLQPDRLPDPQQTEISLTLLGQQYTASYKSKKSVGYGIACFEYRSEQGDVFEVDSSGNIRQYASAASFSHVADFVDAKDALSPEESLEKAKDYLVRIFGEETAARFDAKLPNTSASTVWIVFEPIVDKINGIYSTTEAITFKLSEKGELLSYIASNVGAFDQNAIPTGFTDAKIKEIINASFTTELNNIELSENRTLTTLEGQRVACTMSFRVVNGDSASEWISVLIPLE